MKLKAKGLTLSAIVAVSLLSSVFVFSSFAASAASTDKSASPQATQSTIADAEEPEANEPNESKNNDAEEAAENAQLAGEAKISEQQAIDAVTAVSKDATIESASLESENGKVVYEVIFTDNNGKKNESKVDATTAELLAEDDGNFDYQD